MMPAEWIGYCAPCATGGRIRVEAGLVLLVGVRTGGSPWSTPDLE